MKKLMALFLAVLMVVSLFAGCGSEKAPETEAPKAPAADTPAVEAEPTEPAGFDISEHVVLTMYCIGDEGGIYANQHLDELNKVLKEKINATLEPIMVSWGDYKTKLPMVWASGESFDLTYTANWVSYFDEAAKGAFMEIDELFPIYAPETYAELNEAGYLDPTRVNGNLYMVPQLMPDYTTWFWTYREDLRKKYDCPEIDSYEDLEFFLQTITDNEPEMMGYPQAGTDHVFFHNFLTEQDWCRAIDDNQIGAITYSLLDPTSAFNMVETPEYEAYLQRVREWYVNGFWSQSVLAETTMIRDNFLSGKGAAYLANFANANSSYREISNANPDWEIGVWSADVESGHTEAIAPSNNGTAIGAYSKNPERALMFIELCHQDKEVYRLLMDGIEGITYEADEEKMVKWTPEGIDPTTTNLRNLGMGFGTQKFKLGSQDDSPLVEGYRAQFDAVREFPALSAFVLDRTEIEAELAALQSVYEEYKVPLEKGVVDPVENLPILKQKMKDAGFDKVLEEINRQITEYLAQQ